ncbi:cell division protein FtsA [Desulforamulus putei]|uniref:Cell division protein FtsA n=1 Tax=Desulforamulus putei DSM 12395 TaxID=1121429 RepID=A0A1M5BJ81_9FIRM|nr:cell division protein FtsA [Desulforamulus putei DSM 12395]
MARRHIVGGLDIGTTKVVSVIAEVSPNGYPVIKGLGECPTLGVRKGVVVDKASLGKSIAHAVGLSQAMAGETISEFYGSFPVVSQLTGTLQITDEQLSESIAMAGVKILQVIPSVIASGEAVLTDTHKKIGTVLMDLGGAVTGLAVFDQGVPVYTHSLPIGSEHITSDLAVCLRTSISEGDRIKRSLGLIEPDPASTLEISGVGGHERRKVPAGAARDIIKSRIQEIFELAHQELSQHFRLASLTGGFILTGGGSLLKGVLDLAISQMNCCKVAVGSPAKVGIPREEWTSPVYASAIGLVLYGAKRSTRRSGRLSGWREVLDRFM